MKTCFTVFAAAVLCAFLGLSAPALAAKPVDWSQELVTAQAAMAQGDLRAAYAGYAAVADHNPLAQFMAGLFHENGWGMAADPVQACAWFEKAAARRIPTAEHDWGHCLAEGIGRPQDIPGAIARYRQAASDGHLISLCSAADFYIRGRGVAQDVSLGLAMCTQVAQAPSTPAMLMLARYHEQGEYLPQDLAAARHWYRQAAELRSAEAQYRLGTMLLMGEGGGADPDEALSWFETAASAGHAPAYLPTALLYAHATRLGGAGTLPPEHLAKVYLWLAAAKARDGSPAQRADIDRLQAEVLEVMPAEWRSDLDKKVQEHLARFSP